MHRGTLIYRLKEHSFVFIPQQIGDFTLEVQYLLLDFITYSNTNIRASQISGFHSGPDKWVRKTLDIPVFMSGSLLLVGDVDDTIPVIELKDAKTWCTFYDADSSWVCIGDDHRDKDDIAVEFATNVAVVVNNLHLKALWLKPMIE